MSSKIEAPREQGSVHGHHGSGSHHHSVSKIYVLDTNVILHDASCILRFQENDVAIPMTVLEELDKFKRGNEDIHFQARQFLRTLNELTDDVPATDGVSLGEGKGRLRVVVGKERHPDMDDVFTEDTPDHRILTTAYRLKLDFIGERGR